MPYTDLDLRIIHAQACIAVVKADKTLTTDVDAFWPIYLGAVLATSHPHAASAVSDGEDTARLDWLERNAVTSSYFDQVTLTFTSTEGSESPNGLRETIDLARRPAKGSDE